MKFRKIGIYLLTAALLAVVVFCLAQGTVTETPFSFLAVTDAGTEEIHFWEQTEGEYIVFLPSYLPLSQLYFRSDTPISFNETELSEGMSCGALSLDQPYGLNVEGNPTITFLRSENMPAMYIDTASGSMEKIHEEKGNEEPGDLRLYNTDGTLNYRGSFESVKMRGNNTPYADKKPYSLKLSTEGSLLGMGRAKKWILLSNSFDATNLRNKIVLDFAEKFGLSYSPDSQWMELYLNGEYAGLYLLCERNEVHPERVNLGTDSSFLVSMEMEYRLAASDFPYVVTRGGIPLYIRYSKLAGNALLEIFQSAEDAFYAPDGIDPATGKHWTEIIDLDSWARKYLLEEVFGNIDGGQVSQFFYWDGGEPSPKIYAGPAWDYDMAMGNPIIYSKAVPEMLYLNCPFEFFGSPWYYQLCQDPIFMDYTLELYQKEFLPLMDEVLEQEFPQQAQRIRAAAAMDQRRWGTDSPAEQTEKTWEFLSRRVAFFNDLWLNNRKFVIVRAKTPDRNVNFAISPGGMVPEMPPFEGYSWYLLGTDTPVDIGQPVYEDICMEMRPDVDYAEPDQEGAVQRVESKRNWELWIPVLSITAGFALLFLADVLRMIRSDLHRNDRTKRNKVSS